MLKLYHKSIQVHGFNFNSENTARLLIRCKLLLQGRKLVSQILMVVIKRNELVNFVKEAIELEDRKSSTVGMMDDQDVGHGDLGDFKFDEEAVEQAGSDIVNYTVVI